MKSKVKCINSHHIVFPIYAENDYPNLAITLVNEIPNEARSQVHVSPLYPSLLSSHLSLRLPSAFQPYILTSQASSLYILLLRRHFNVGLLMGQVDYGSTSRPNQTL